MEKLTNGRRVDSGTQLALEMRTKAQELLDTAKRLEGPRLARGTGDVTAEARAASGAIASPGAYRVGDEGPTPELMQAVHRMLAEHPLTFQQILDMTGARANRVKGVIMRLQREGVPVVNIGTEAKAIWFCPSAEVLKRLQKIRIARMKRK